MDHSNNALSVLQLKTLQAEFNEISREFADKAKLLAPQIAAAEAAARKDENLKLLKTFSPNGAVDFDGRDVTVYINRSADMGTGFAGFAGQAVRSLMGVRTATEDCTNSRITGNFWSAGTPNGIKIGDIGSIDGLLSKPAAGTAKDILPVAKEILNNNTPDRAGDKPRHYIILLPATLSDDVVFARQLFDAAQNLNPKATFDYVVCGGVEADAYATAKKLCPTASPTRDAIVVSKSDDIASVITSILKQRVETSPVAKKPEIQPVTAPKPAA